jgi:hypothetical protein
MKKKRQKYIPVNKENLINSGGDSDSYLLTHLLILYLVREFFNFKGSRQD